LAKSSVARSIFLLLLIIIVAAGGLVWFDYLNVIDIKTLLSPIYNKFGMQGRSQPAQEKGEMLNLDAERLAVRLQALDLQMLELNSEKTDIDKRREQVEQMAAELDTREQGLNDKEQTLNTLSNEAESKDRILEESARNYVNMPPQNAVAILEQMDDQDAINIMRKVEEMAQRDGTASIVSFWISLMKPEKAAELQRKKNIMP
jgi:flagellar protein FlbB